MPSTTPVTLKTYRSFSPSWTASLEPNGMIGPRRIAGFWAESRCANSRSVRATRAEPGSLPQLPFSASVKARTRSERSQNFGRSANGQGHTLIPIGFTYHLHLATHVAHELRPVI